jgi:hypothetical protein
MLNSKNREKRIEDQQRKRKAKEAQITAWGRNAENGKN